MYEAIEIETRDITTRIFTRTYFSSFSFMKKNKLSIKQFKELRRVHANFEFWLNIMAEKNKNYVGINMQTEAFRDEPHKDFQRAHWMWLLDGLNVEEVSEKAATVIIQHKDENASMSNYALVTYVALQDEAFQNSMRGIPASMLEEMFDPMAVSNFQTWMER
jgi:hypothetical protein